jgi:hypothetical protein
MPGGAGTEVGPALHLPSAPPHARDLHHPTHCAHTPFLGPEMEPTTKHVRADLLAGLLEVPPTPDFHLPVQCQIREIKSFPFMEATVDGGLLQQH